VTVDCGWTLPNRTAEGTLTPNPAYFPNGYPALGEFLHGLGLKFGVYQDGGIKTCMTGEPTQAGSLGKSEYTFLTEITEVLTSIQDLSRQTPILLLPGELIF